MPRMAPFLDCVREEETNNGNTFAVNATQPAEVGQQRCTARPRRQHQQQQHDDHPICCFSPHFRHCLPPKMLIRLSLLFLFTVVGWPMPGGVTATARSRRTLVPLGMDKQMFPPQIFDENAPICTAEREPCGFYSFSLDGKAPLKWIKSWCRCSAQHECVYERTDMRMRVYRQTCISHDDLLPGDDVGEETTENDAAALRQQQSVVLVETVPSATSADRDHHDTVVEEEQQDDDLGHPQRTHRHHHHHHHHSNRHHHRHNNAVTATYASRHSRKTHRQRQVIRRLRELVMDD